MYILEFKIKRLMRFSHISLQDHVYSAIVKKPPSAENEDDYQQNNEQREPRASSAIESRIASICYWVRGRTAVTTIRHTFHTPFLYRIIRLWDTVLFVWAI